MEGRTRLAEKSQMRLNPWRKSVNVSPTEMPMSIMRILRKVSFMKVSMILSGEMEGPSTSSTDCFLEPEQQLEYLERCSC